jgi:hypothetical protein
MKNIIESYKAFEDDQVPDNAEEVKEEDPEFTGYITFLPLARIASTPGASYQTGGRFIHIANNLYDVFEDIFTLDLLNRMDWKENFWDLMTDPIGVFPKFIESKLSDTKCLDFKIYKGFTPNYKKRDFIKLSSISPFSAVFNLDRYLQNAEKVFDGQAYSPTFSERNKFKNEDEIKQTLTQNPLLLYLLDSKPEEKERMIKELGIKDLSKIGKGLKMGLI